MSPLPLSSEINDAEGVLSAFALQPLRPPLDTPPFGSGFETDDTPKNICIVSRNFPHASNVHFSAHSSLQLAAALSRAGHRVTYLHYTGRHGDKSNFKTLVERVGATYQHISRRADSTRGAVGMSMAFAYAVYRSLSDQYFDVLYADADQGPLYYCQLAREQGLGFRQTRFVVSLSETRFSQIRDGLRPIHGPSEILFEYLERRTVEMADRILAPTDAIINRIWQIGYQIDPSRTLVIPPLIDDPILFATFEQAVPAPSQPKQTTGPGKLIFWLTNLEDFTLKAFFNTIDRLVHKGVPPTGVEFLLPRRRKHLRKLVDDFAKGVPFPCNLATVSNAEALRAALASPQSLTVVPGERWFSFYAGEIFHRLGIDFIVYGDESQRSLYSDWQDHFIRAHPLDLTETIARRYLGEKLVYPRLDYSPNEAATQLDRVMRDVAPVLNPYPGTPVETPLVSICLVSHNRPGLLQQALDSIRQQDYPNIEVILIDDGSPNEDIHELYDTLENEFQENRWKILHQENQYLGVARNNAARAASGKYLLFMDDDNIAFSDEVSTLSRIAESTQIDILTTFCRAFRGLGKPGTRRGQLRNTITPLGGCLAYGVYRNPFGDANCLVRKEVFDALGGYSEDYRIGKDDMEFYIRAVSSGYRLEPVPKTLFYYRISDTTMKNMHFSADRGVLRVMRGAARHIPNVYFPALIYSAHLSASNENLRQQLREARMPGHFLRYWILQGARLIYRGFEILIGRKR